MTGKSKVHYWLLKTEPETFSWAELVARGARGEPWDGVRNHQAAGFLRAMNKGDHAFIYHSGKARSVIGTALVTRASFPDPSDASGRFVAVGVRALEALEREVSLAEIKAEPSLADLLLVRHSRLSVMPVGAAEWQQILRMSRQ